VIDYRRCTLPHQSFDYVPVWRSESCAARPLPGTPAPRRARDARLARALSLPTARALQVRRGTIRRSCPTSRMPVPIGPRFPLDPRPRAIDRSVLPSVDQRIVAARSRNDDDTALRTAKTASAATAAAQRPALIWKLKDRSAGEVSPEPPSHQKTLPGSEVGAVPRCAHGAMPPWAAE
jgi:hypothetical protein